MNKFVKIEKMNKKEQLDLLNELLVYIMAFEKLEPHFAQRRRIKELEEQIQKLK